VPDPAARLGWDAIIGRRLQQSFLSTRARKRQIVDVVRSTCGIQAQSPPAAELALGLRVDLLTRDDVRTGLADRGALVRTFGPRDTVHLLPAADLGLWMAARRAVPIGRRWTAPWAISPGRAAKLLDAVDAALADGPLERSELAAAASKRAGAWAEERLAAGRADLIALAGIAGVLCFGPPRGSRVTFVRAADWVGDQTPPDPRDALREIVRRYLHAYGPARSKDIAAWYAPKLLTAEDCARLLAELGDEVVEVTVGRTSAHMLRGDLDAAAEAPSVRLVSRYDCYLLGSRFGRQHLVARDVHRRLAAHPRGRYEGSAGHNCVLVDGRVQGMWEPRLLDDRVEARVEMFAPTDSAERQMLDREAERLAAFYERPAELVTAELDQPS